jgi:type IV pilus biogenesis protein PilP
MSRRTRRFVPARRRVLSCVLALAATPAIDAQTIADYSRAQRLLLESTMAQAAARSAGLGASIPAVGAPSSVTPLPALQPARASLPQRPQGGAPLPVPATLQVSGVFASSRGVVAEVVVNATPYLLGAGQGVPGTAWRVESVTVDGVVLARRGAAPTAPEAPGARKVFPLPALR